MLQSILPIEQRPGIVDDLAFGTSELPSETDFSLKATVYNKQRCAEGSGASRNLNITPACLRAPPPVDV